MKIKLLTSLSLSMVLVAVMSACGGGGSSSDTKSEINSTIEEGNATVEEVAEETNDTLPIDNNFTITSKSFTDGGKIPSINVCIDQGGSNQSPQLSWLDAPKSTAKYAIIMDDEVAPCGTGDNACKHWGLFNIPSSISEVSEDLEIATIEGTVEGRNYLGTQDYAGPCPPSRHIYKITVFALKDTMPKVGSISMTRSKFESTYGEHILDSTTISGTFP